VIEIENEQKGSVRNRLLEKAGRKGWGGGVPSDAASKVLCCPPWPTEHFPWSPLPPATIAFSSCSSNELGPEGATALSSGLTALTNLRSIGIG
jgi:hypothetical protein